MHHIPRPHLQMKCMAQVYTLLQSTIYLWNTTTLNFCVMMTLSIIHTVLSIEQFRHLPSNRKTYIFKLQIERWLEHNPPEYLACINNSKVTQITYTA